MSAGQEIKIQKLKRRHFLGAALVVTFVLLVIYESNVRAFTLWGDKLEDQGERRQVVFAKVHKAASSTVQNVLLRFAMARELDVLLPRKGNHINENGAQINPGALISHQEGKPFDILCNHLVYNAEQIAAYIPRGAFTFGILREPLSQALSALQYYATFYLVKGSLMWHTLRRHGTDPVRGFLNHPEEFCDEKWKTDFCFVDNRMSMDLGFSSTGMYESKRDPTKIRNFIASISRQFDLMLMFEHFDESMVLLRRYLRWQIKDVLYIKVNVAPPQGNNKWNRSRELSPTQRAIFQQWAAVDIALYNYFLAQFLRKIESEDSFNDEVESFKQIRSNVDAFCNSTRGDSNQLLKVSQSRWTDEFSVTKSDCRAMTMSEDEIVQTARSKQLARLASLSR
ncbi:hypothetical protein EGW08_011676 [Elysia chlorotica]|uniref:Galactose-3-O-sulfotransferase 3 n=1 Tax=Elysia chlorotica TaxID=188477 RepID=A0A433TG73_ELYCH|nr:hypothetical protein EGW08_011676 [Elysia chlorotica]